MPEHAGTRAGVHNTLAMGQPSTHDDPQGGQSIPSLEHTQANQAYDSAPSGSECTSLKTAVSELATPMILPPCSWISSAAQLPTLP